MENVSSETSEQYAIEEWPSSDMDVLAGRELNAPQQKQLLKTLRFLRDDLKYQSPNIALPSTWILKNVIRASRVSMYRPDKWQSDLDKTLNDIDSLISLEREGTTQFYNDKMSKKLFPTIDNFDLDDLALFIAATKAHLDTIYT